MGAYDFRVTSLGRTAGDAFAAANEQARWEHGNGGYTGTIAEKHDFFLVELPKGMTLAKLDKVVQQVQSLGYDIQDAQDESEWGTKAKRLSAAKRLGRLQAKRELILGKLGYQGRRAVEQVIAAYADKWGAAAAVEVTGAAAREAKARAGRAGTRDKVFVFMGSASS